MNQGRGVTLVALTLLVALLTSPAMARRKKTDSPELPPTRQDITVVGFSTNGKEVVCRVVDENIGTLFQVRSVKKGKVLASFPFSEGGEKRAWRKVKRAHNVDKDFSDAPENPRKKVVMMSQVKGDKILIHMMRGEAIKPYLKIPLYKNKKGQPAEAFVKQMVWDQKGKFAESQDGMGGLFKGVVGLFSGKGDIKDLAKHGAQFALQNKDTFSKLALL